MKIKIIGSCNMCGKQVHEHGFVKEGDKLFHRSCYEKQFASHSKKPYQYARKKSCFSGSP
ncbi:hypothetical protein DW103_16860 [Parabacteroides sp. AM08-6]|nr:hypothetical protein DW103_16860 [Parabacteroides sp. AM08-6]